MSIADVTAAADVSAAAAAASLASSEKFQTTSTTGASRRDAVFALASLLASPSFAFPSRVEAGEAKLAVAAATRAQTVYAGFCIPIIEKCVTAPLADVLALAIRDAGTFDNSTGTGGLNGSIRFELDRPENARFRGVFEQLERAKKEIDAEVTEPIGWADLIALAAAGKARYSFLREFCGTTPRFDSRWQYKAGDITRVGCDYDAMLTPPFGNSPEQIEATSWFRQNYASTGPLTGARVHVGRADAQTADPAGLIPPEGATAAEYIAWFQRMRMSIPALVNLAPYVDPTCEVGGCGGAWGCGD
jgi:L-ascorbate peroxidase